MQQGMKMSGERAETQLRKVLTVRHAVALYVSSVLGAGVLVIPGLAARIAGPASMVSWVILTLASYPFAYTFASLSARSPASGGIYSFAKESFGAEVSTATSWLFIAWVVMGAPAITLAAGSYVASVISISKESVFAIALLIIGVAYGVNLRGIRLSGRVQVGIVATIVLLLSFGVVASLPRVSPVNLSPFLPNGPVSVGVACALILWSYLGYENVSNVAEEFKDPKRDFRRSVTLSVVLIGALYLSVAFVIVGTGAYNSGSGVAPFVELMSNLFGVAGAAAVAILAVVIIFGAVNAYTAGLGRVVYAAAKDGSLPRVLGKIDPKTGVPQRALVALLGLVIVSLFVFYALQLNVQSGFLATSGAAILVYVVGSAAGCRLLEGRGSKALALASLAASLAILAFIGILLIPSLVVAALGLAYGHFAKLG
jgi:amino acid efflux transporter